MDTEIQQDDFLRKAYVLINNKVIFILNFRGLTVNYRGNVMELPIASIRGCHYEIAFHKDCHEIALHFQGTAENNKYRSEGFRPYKQQLQSDLGYPIVIGSHEKTGIRKRLWIRLPLEPLTQNLLEKYSELISRLIILTLPILQSIINDEIYEKKK
jgi:hypothetical protein